MNELKKIFIIANYTFKELYKSRILLITVLMGLFFIFISLIATELTYAHFQKVSLDISLGLISLSTKVISIFMGVQLLSKEIENRTFYISLSRSVSRRSFLVGKIIGMSFILLVNIFILSLVSWGLHIYFNGEVGRLLLLNPLFLYIESMIILSIVVLFSLITTPVISIMGAISLFFFGMYSREMLVFKTIEENIPLQRFISFLGNILPDFSRFNLKEYILYEKFISPEPLLYSFFYGLVYFLVVVMIAVTVFNRKNLN